MFYHYSSSPRITPSVITPRCFTIIRPRADLYKYERRHGSRTRLAGEAGQVRDDDRKMLDLHLIEDKDFIHKSINIIIISNQNIYCQKVTSLKEEFQKSSLPNQFVE